MKRTALAFLAAFAVAGVAACVKDYKFGQLGKEEFVILRVHKTNNQCKLASSRAPEVRTDSAGQVSWLIVGNCDPTDTIEIKPDFKKGGAKHQILVGLSPKPAIAGNTITGTVKQDLPKGLRKGHYRYEVWINNAPAEFNPRADDGSFFLCPVWPCGGFDN